MTGRVALVTGAASGVGRATALELARLGADLCLVDLNAAPLDEAAGEARAAGVKVHVYAADLSRRETCSAAVAETMQAFGRLDALCNIAGVFLPANTHDMPADHWELTMSVNLSAPFYLIQAAIPHLLAVDGAVVNVTSCAGISAQAYSAAYCATKAGLNHMTKSLALEYMHKPIRFNAVAPGGMLTTMTRTVQFPADMDRELFQRCSPLRGLVPPEDVAEMVAFLCSSASKSYHGAIITIDNGITAD
ncbi:MAG: SDR family oxidoreductase [Sphingomicrobium sp.]